MPRLALGWSASVRSSVELPATTPNSDRPDVELPATPRFTFAAPGPRSDPSSVTRARVAGGRIGLPRREPWPGPAPPADDPPRTSAGRPLRRSRERTPAVDLREARKPAPPL